MDACVKRIGVSGGVASMLLAGAAQATILTETVYGKGFGLAAVSQFDPGHGTLLSVHAEASYTSWLPYKSFFAPVGYDHAVSGLATLGGFSFALDGASQASWSGATGLFSVTASGATTWTNPADIALFAGSGTILGYAAAGTPPPGTPISGNYVPVVDYKLTYTFDNSPAVPEPATWAMMVGGFVLIGLALRLARRNRAPARASKA